MMRKFIIFAVVVAVMEATPACDHEKTCCCNKDKCDVIIVSGCGCNRYCNSSTEATSDSANTAKSERIADGDDSRLPRNLRVEPAGFGNLLATWEPPSGSSGNEEIRGYSIMWVLSSDGKLTRQRNIGMVRQFLLQGLLENSKYGVYVSAVYANGPGPSAFAIGRTLPAGTALQAPNLISNLKADVLHSRAVSLHWTLFSSPEDPIAKTIVRYSMVKNDHYHDLENPPMYRVHGHSYEAAIEIEDLEPAKQYIFCVNAFNAREQIVSNDCVEATTPAELLLAPQDFRIDQEQSGQYTLTWTDPGNVGPVEYVVRSRGWSANETLVCERTFTTSTTKHTLTNLQWDLYYVFSIIAQNGMGVSPATVIPPMQITKPETFEQNPGNHGSSQDSDSVAISNDVIRIVHPDSVKTGDTVKLTCTVDCQTGLRKNNSTFQWLMDDGTGNFQEIPLIDKFKVSRFTDDTSFGAMLKILNFDRADERVYMCHINSNGQNYRKDVTLNGIINRFDDQPDDGEENPTNDDFPQSPNEDGGSAIMPKEEVYIRYPLSIKVGDTVPLSCTVNYQDRRRENKGTFRWFMDDGTGNFRDVPASTKFQVSSFTDDTSYGEVLRIHNFDRADQRPYICEFHVDDQVYTSAVTLNGVLNEFVGQPGPPRGSPKHRHVMPPSAENSFQPSAPVPNVLKSNTRHPRPRNLRKLHEACA